MRARGILAGFALLGICGTGVSSVVSVVCGINFLLGYGVFGVIMSGSFLHIKRQLAAVARASESHDLSQDSHSPTKSHKPTAQCDTKKDSIPSPSRFVVGTKLSFSLVRIVGYMMFLAGIGGLLYYDMLMSAGLFAGITCAVVYMVWVGAYMLRDKWQSS